MQLPIIIPEKGGSVKHSHSTFLQEDQKTAVIPAKAGIRGFLKALRFAHYQDSRLHGNDQIRFPIKQVKSLRAKAMSLHKPKPSWISILQILLPMNRDQNDIVRRVDGSFVLLLFLLLTPTLTTAQTATAPSGSGTSGDPYLIATLDNLYWLSQNSSVWEDNAYFEQTADIDASSTITWHSGRGFSPIGDVIGNSNVRFNGTYDGGGYIIENLYINRSSQNDIALFGRTNGATITDLGLVNVNFTGVSDGGGLIGSSEGDSITRCYVTGTITGAAKIGGLVGISSDGGTISNSYADVTLISSGGSAGGLVGSADDIKITNSYSIGILKGEDNTGGLIGLLTGTDTLSNNYSAMIVASTSGIDAGGFVGSNVEAIITDNYLAFELSEIIDAFGSNSNSQTVTELTNAGMRAEASFPGFDFTSTWQIDEGSSFPYLRDLAAPDTLPGTYVLEVLAPSGSGTEGDPYQISSLENLRWMFAYDETWDDHFIQTADINASETSIWPFGFPPIGNSTTAFTGVYDGENYSISDLHINRDDTDEVGLFGLIDDATITNLALENVDISGEDKVGALAGSIDNGLTISNISISGEVTGSRNIGGAVGYIGPTASSSDSLIHVSSSADIVATYSAGGIVGQGNSLTIANNVFTGSVNTTNNAGGIVGENYDVKIVQSYSTGSINGGFGTGGLVGFSSDGDIEDSYATGTVSGGRGVGGLLGYGEHLSVSSSYSTGSVTGTENVGGFIGEFSGNTVTDSYWNTESSGLSDGFGQNSTSESVTGLTTAEMVSQSSFSGFDFGSTWAMQDYVSFPYLQEVVPDTLPGSGLVDMLVEAPAGSGTSGDPYLIANLFNLRWLSETESVWDDNAYFEQTADIDASSTSTWDSGQGFTPIGTSANNFVGIYDGKDYSISGLTINRPGTSNVGLFGRVSSSDIQNLDLAALDVTGNQTVGGLIGYAASSTITHVTTSGTISGSIRVGGMIGRLASGTLSHSGSTSTIAGGDYIVSGLVGHNQGTISESYFSGTITGALYGSNAGGIAGENEGTIRESYSSGDISVMEGYSLGGLAGLNASSGSVIDSYATGSVEGDRSVAGLVGYNEGTIMMSYFAGSLSGSSEVGGVIGENDGGTLTEVYWDTELSGTGTAIGIDYGSSGSATGLTSFQMAQQASFTGFDFSTTWTMEEYVTFPYLQQIVPDTLPGSTLPIVASPGGSGTEQDPYLIADIFNLRWLSETESVWDDGAYFEQTADIDASLTAAWEDSAGFTPIGSSATNFVGNYDGKGFVIDSLVINRPNSSFVGLFGRLGGTATITNVAVTHAEVAGSGSSGVLVGFSTAGASVTNSAASGLVTVGGNDTGGLVGQNEGTISDSYFSGTVSGIAEENNVGGIAGLNSGIIIRSYVAVDILASAALYIGGIAGQNDADGSVIDSYATGNLESYEYTGGIAGLNEGAITTSYFAGSLSGLSAGGAIGEAAGSILTDVFWDTELSGTGTAVGSIFTTSSGSATGLASVEMLSQSSFSGFDFGSVWAMEDYGSFPYLQNQVPESLPGSTLAQSLSVSPEGSGTEQDPYLIATLENLYWLSQAESVWDDNAYFEQTADIDASAAAAWDDSAGFTPIGNTATSFVGNYDGGNYSISGLTINLPGISSVGLFGRILNSDITDLSLTGLDITGDHDVGGLVGYVFSSDITNVTTAGTISGSIHPGGVIGRLESGTLTQGGSVSTVILGDLVAGGLVGRNKGTISESYFSGAITGGVNTRTIGGIAGENGGGTIRESYSSGDISVPGGEIIGGLAGENNGLIIDSYATGSVEGDETVGGIVGVNDGNITMSYFAGSLSGSVPVGGVVGENNGGTLTEVFWDTELSGTGTDIGAYFDGIGSGTGLTTAQMAQQASFSGFDFGSVWAVEEYVSFPYLQAVVPDTLPGSGLVDMLVEAPAGSGTEQDPYLIANLFNLRWLSETSSAWAGGTYFEQTADIDASSTAAWEDSAGFAPIGNIFNGNYDGKGYVIDSLVINRPGAVMVGMFRWLGAAATITNVHVTNAEVTGLSFIGILAGRTFSNASITHSSASGEVTAGSGNNVGGLVGASLGPISGSYFNGTITGVAADRVGGIVGTNAGSGSITDSYAAGSVEGSSRVGGIVGYNSGPITSSYFAGSLSGSSAVGGVIGEATAGTLTEVYWDTELSGTGTAIGSGSVSGSATGLTTAQMTQQASFSGFDFGSTWAIQEYTSFPYLQNLVPEPLPGSTEIIIISPEGSGTEQDPYLIANLSNLRWLSETVSVWDDNAYFEQSADIDASATAAWNNNAGFSPIGTAAVSFVGNYDGKGYSISGLNINRPGTDNIGLFGRILNSEIQNLSLIGLDVTGDEAVGGLVGYIFSSDITNVTTAGTISGTNLVAGIIAYLDSGTLSQGVSTAAVTGTSAATSGLVGQNMGTISDSYFNGEITGGNAVIGGVAGDNEGAILRSYSSGDISASNGTYIGGLVGYNRSGSSVINSYATGNITGDEYLGGIAGFNEGAVTTSYFAGSLSGSSSVGGVIGEGAGGTLTEVYWDTELSGTATAIGTGSGSATGLTTVQMTQQANFSGFDFGSAWAIQEYVSFPYLQGVVPDTLPGSTLPIVASPGGSGSEQDPYLIANIFNLRWLSETESVWDDNAYFEQTADIDASLTAAWEDSAGFAPIGSSTTNFVGSYDGKGFVIDSLVINRPNSSIVGLFGYVGGAGTAINNIHVTNAEITGRGNMGILVGWLSTTGASIANSTASGLITVAGIGTINTGGLIGYNVGTISGSHFSGTLTGGEVNNIGGIAGENEGTIRESYANVDMSFTEGVYIGGLAGFNSGLIINSYATGSLEAHQAVGGIAGANDNGGDIATSYFAGSLSGSSLVGGVIGEQRIAIGIFTGVFWDTELSGAGTATGSGSSGSAAGLTTFQMLQQVSFTGFDFDSTWAIQDYASFPYLQGGVPEPLPGSALTLVVSPEGSGSEQAPYLMANVLNLRWLSETESVWDDDAYFEQTADINASATAAWNDSAGFTPIGNASTNFAGNYDGKGYSISGLTVNRPGTSNVGLFGRIQHSGIDNLSLIGLDVTGQQYVGGLAGYAANSDISAIYTEGTISATSEVAGMIGTLASGTLSQGISAATVTGTDFMISGLVGYNEGTISDSYFNGTLTGAPGASTIGGIAGDNFGTILRSHSSGDISAIDGNYLGGIAGGNGGGFIINSYATGSITGDESVGGIVGISEGAITRSYFAGSLSGSAFVGGVIGESSGGILTEVFWNTELSGTTTAIGTGPGSATGLTTAQMIDSTNFSGWDFASDTAWAIDQGFSFPYLKDLGYYRMAVATIDSGQGWRLIGHPGDITYTDFLDPIFTQGYEGSDAGTGHASNVYFFEESTQTWTVPSNAGDYFGTAQNSSENTASNGILLYVFGDDDGDGNEDAWPKYLVSEFTNLADSFSVDLSYTSSFSTDSAGWNLVSNPYPVALDWTEVISDAGIDVQSTFPVAYMWDHTLNDGNGSYRISFGYTLPPGLNQDFLTNDPIPAMQSFWVKTSSTGTTLSFKPAYQTASEKLFKQAPSDEPAESPWLNLTILHSEFSDQLTFLGADGFMAPKLSTIAGRYVEAAVELDDALWAARSLPELESGQELLYPIALSTTETGTFTFNWQGLETFANDWNFVLIDHLTGEQVSLREEASYSFELSEALAKPVRAHGHAPQPHSTQSSISNDKNEPRFALKMAAGSLEPDSDLPTVVALDQNYPNPFNPSTNIRFELPETGNVELIVFDVLGRKVATLINERVEAGYHQLRFNARDLASGMYIYQLRTSDVVITKKLMLIK